MSQTTSASVERNSSRKRWTATDLGLIAVFAALVAASAIVPGIPVGALGVPITLVTLTVMLSGLVLGPGRGFAAVGLYVLLGLAGLPIFSGGRSGLGILATASAGYIIAFPLAAAATGYLAALIIRKTIRNRSLLLFAAAMVSSIVLIHGLGVLGMMVNGKLDFTKAFIADLAFYPGDILKNILAVIIAVAIHKAFPDVLVRKVK
ncbi:biotin transporter BioY [Arthrobacter sp. StoSoilB5]|jgi:biotin transport system substrate-specific component|uniref:biotin transporter BioY n=1 Tax=Arthrobacter sp. StoSoilB5 TaxID=2830992 RepID=UPI001CC3D5CD|nr:biotin transporter BioY [Arthrobacter sp. StoSoilB5]BCW45589.1 biotin transporter BioY [Arthrobacter sp. StoSoilB5]